MEHRSISYEYLYRDGANYKNWGEVILAASATADIPEIEEKIRKALIDECNFVAEDMKIPTLYFLKTDEEIDHGWHEFLCVTWTNKTPTDQRTIDEFVADLEFSQKPYRLM